MKKLISSMIISMIIGQPILAGPLSMDITTINGDPKLQDASNLDEAVWPRVDDGRAQFKKGSLSADSLQRTGTKYVGAPVITDTKSRTKGWARGMLGGALALGVLSWLQFDRASDNEAEAALNRDHGQLARAQKLDDKADRRRLYGWSTAVLAAGFFGVALISLKTTHPVLPELSFRDGEPCVGVSYAYSF